MASIIYVGMDVHTTNFTFCCYTADSDRGFAVAQTEPDYRQVIKYMERVQKQRGEECKFVCGYEAGCLGYSLYHQLTRCGVDCVILAPSTMHQEKGKRIKTDRRDAENIARCLAFSLYSPVYVPTTEDDAVKEYIRMRDDIKADLKRVKQQIIAFTTRHGFAFDGKSYWTQKHLKWLETLVFEHPLYKETLQEYLILYYMLDEKVAVYDTRIEEMSHLEHYEENVQKLCCFRGVAAHTALSLLVEVAISSVFALPNTLPPISVLFPENIPVLINRYAPVLQRQETPIYGDCWSRQLNPTIEEPLGKRAQRSRPDRAAILPRSSLTRIKPMNACNANITASHLSPGTILPKPQLRANWPVLSGV